MNSLVSELQFGPCVLLRVFKHYPKSRFESAGLSFSGNSQFKSFSIFS